MKNKGISESFDRQISFLNDYKKRYETPFNKSKYSIVKNRIRKIYLNNVNEKIISLENEKYSMCSAKDGLEMVMYHTAYNSHAPFSVGKDGDFSPISFRVELMKRYEDVLDLNVNIMKNNRLKTFEYTKFILYNKKKDVYVSEIKEFRCKYLPFCIEEDQYMNFPLELISCRVSELVKKSKYKYFFDLIPVLCSISEGTGNLRHVYKFIIRVC